MAAWKPGLAAAGVLLGLALGTVSAAAEDGHRGCSHDGTVCPRSTAPVQVVPRAVIVQPAPPPATAAPAPATAPVRPAPPPAAAEPPAQPDSELRASPVSDDQPVAVAVIVTAVGILFLLAGLIGAGLHLRTRPGRKGNRGWTDG